MASDLAAQLLAAEARSGHLLLLLIVDPLVETLFELLDLALDVSHVCLDGPGHLDLRAAQFF